MAVTEECEDVISICLTALHRLLNRCQRDMGIEPKDIGRLEVGSETNPDKSKSIKTHLMQLFPAGCHDIGGVDNVNACFGGAAALFNTISWMESEDWDGRWGIVVVGDVSEYERGPARPTGGAGAIAMLVGPNAPLPIERGTSTYYMAHKYDFYKPQPDSPYPIVDGPESIACFTSALDYCYGGHLRKISTKKEGLVKLEGGATLSASNFDKFVFHSPFNKLVQKSFTRIIHTDLSRNPSVHGDALCSYGDIAPDKATAATNASLAKDSQALFQTKVSASTVLPKATGNCYTASIFLGLASLLRPIVLGQDIIPTRIGMFSYGSGTAACMFSILPNADLLCKPAIIKNLLDTIALEELLSDRYKISPKQFDELMTRKLNLYGKPSWTPSESRALRPGIWKLVSVDALYRRHYTIHTI